MAQVTQLQRIQRIEELLRDLNKVPPEKHEVQRLPWPGTDLLCQVIQISADEVLLNPRSHRVRSQLQDNSEWLEVSADPFSLAAQKIIERLVRAARSENDFAALRDSLFKEGQTDPGVITYDGVLVNANTRAVAIRSFEDPGKRYLRVAVLPRTASADEMSLLELRLQMQKELKVEYTLTNELLFIEELSSERRLTDGQIARELRIAPESPKRGETEVNLRLRLLDLLRHLQQIPTEKLPLSFFDKKLSYEQLREVHRNHQGLLDSDPLEAEHYLESFLLTVAVGITPVHKIRKIDNAFMTRYMLPQLEEDEQVGRFATQLATSATKTPPAAPQGAKALMGNATAAPTQDGEPQVDAKQLLDLVTGRDKTVHVPSSNFSFAKQEVVEAIKAAVTTGIKDKDRDLRDENKLDAPIDAVKAANAAMARALDNVVAVALDPEFDDRRRKTLEAAFKRLTRTQRSLEAALTKSGILGR